MNSKNQNIKKFYARRLVILLIVIIVFTLIGIISMFPVQSSIHIFNISCVLVMLVSLICRYFMVYISIGDDFITFQPAPIRSEVSVLFDEVKSITYSPKKIFINYQNKVNGKDKKLKISLDVLEKDAKEDLLETLHTIFKDKEV